MLINHYYTINSKTEEAGKTIFQVRLNPESEVYKGHFPENPVSPGVCNVQMVVECASQIENKKFLLKNIKRCRFLKVITPSSSDFFYVKTEIEKINAVHILTASIHDSEDICLMDIKCELVPAPGQISKQKPKTGYDVVIIGTGLGGLECGYMLSKEGLNVCLIEKEKQIGGCLQTFKRDGTLFDTGFHYAGGLKEGQALNRIFSYFGLLELPWHQMDETGFEEVIIDGQSYMHASGHERFASTLAVHFPDQRKNLESYTAFLKGVGEGMFNVFEGKSNLQEFYSSLFAKSTKEYLYTTFSNNKLIDVVSGTSFKIGLNDKLPLYIFAQINESFIESAWRLKGGGSLIANSLANQIKSMGGTIIANNEVVSLKEENGKITSAVLSDDEEVKGEIFISNAHPAQTLNLLKTSKSIRSSYRKRICSLKNSFGVFTVNIKLKENRIPYLNRNIHIHSSDKDRKFPPVVVSFAIPETGSYAANIDILAPMDWNEVSVWDGTRIGQRGKDYAEFKQKRANEYIDLVGQYIPGLKEAVDKIYISTPLTYKDYTGTEEGSAYGIEKDFERTMYTILAPNTPVSNLFMTGQNLCVHGVLGVSMTSLVTCGQILGMQTVRLLVEN